ncbi:uncharacterized protein N7482_006397 [Penicillium canariense]|uniref:Terpenoid synthase n=1 Tax=Penicillium canariense TaxID=189055 RepID=A0A9W9LJC7_9EURO|nr:uncharacterized protein N7482_006397 [Penicillium canariense]KAJ5159393.1 hypothetical protein N7482_006397 [Penicillium canariense]
MAFAGSPDRDEITKTTYEAIMKDMLKTMNRIPSYEQLPCAHIYDQIVARISQVTLNQKLAKRVSKVAALVAIYFYPWHDEDVQLVIGMYTAFYLVLDDEGDTMVAEISQFRQRLLKSEKQSAPFEMLAYLFSEFDRVFPSMVANKLFAGVLASLTSLEIELDRSTEFTGVGSPMFAKYFRNMNGSSEAYVYFLMADKEVTAAQHKHFLQAVPELWNITDEINDLMSFYKESIGGDERDTYVYHQARSTGVSIQEALRNLAKDIVRRRHLIGRIFQDDDLLRDKADQYITGQIEFYLTSERYRLSELHLA